MRADRPSLWSFDISCFVFLDATLAKSLITFVIKINKGDKIIHIEIKVMIQFTKRYFSDRIHFVSNQTQDISTV
ncbi:hypothetical protein DX928_12885 [Bacillus swezeyi]|uniref:Uncharacterized protein n=1 Tax=Bacillus swezeyi TaxID=1925020 RepID=A0A5M8RUG2_9BACI|nr:hypothetical protein DX927_08585 [Bacillus swezeyi]KAA6474918.1 hypothetical protein DX928_12885 [Bacillus swezeyi]